MIAVDTNVLVRAAVGDDVKQSETARAIMSDARGLAVSLVVLCEFVWVASKVYGLSASEIARSIRALIADPKVVCDRQAVNLGLQLLESGGDFADGAMLVDAHRLGADTLATFDKLAVKLLSERGYACTLLPSR